MNDAEPPKPATEDLDVATELLTTDLEQLFAEHSAGWDRFHSLLKVLLTVAALPLLAGGAFVSSRAFTSQQLSDLTQLPRIVGWLVLGSAALLLLLLPVLVHYRLDILMYARAINQIRGYYVELLKQADSQVQFDPHMPTSSKVPENFEPLRIMGLLVLVFALISSTYAATGLAIVLHGFRSWVIITAILLIPLQYVMYFATTRRTEIAGQRKAVTKDKQQAG